MKGFTCMLALILSSLSFANTTMIDTNKKILSSTQLGCMACHQGESIQPATIEKKKEHNTKHHTRTS